MKRCILVDVRQNKDEKTGDELMFLTLVKLPSKMSNGGLWHPRQNEMIVNVCINKTNKNFYHFKMRIMYIVNEDIPLRNIDTDLIPRIRRHKYNKD